MGCPEAFTQILVVTALGAGDQAKGQLLSGHDAATVGAGTEDRQSIGRRTSSAGARIL
jgi:hypothetical protein